jgi:hypothetical protein
MMVIKDLILRIKTELQWSKKIRSYGLNQEYVIKKKSQTINLLKKNDAIVAEKEKYLLKFCC